ncbi:hypothetical protein IQ07DRAFT_669205 [Pyrenochaeta sp. DS3sAY3a]|nr:hypothetical protein IQ07DRAFT_669205 [Pyrenochaeta sp. DS3sAY3a]
MNERQSKRRTRQSQATGTHAFFQRSEQGHLAATEDEISSAAWPLIHLAATCSEEAYSDVVSSTTHPCAAPERIKISQRNVDLHGQVTVVAVSGTRGLKDWMVNLRNSTVEPEDILGEKRNLCHSGFLETVRLLIDPLALSLSAVENGVTLLFTGHSAGAAIASLLYAHVRTTEVSSLAQVVARFESVHCIVFGAPPISIAPLQEHDHEGSSSRRSLILSLINDGDPITKADAQYVAKKCGWLNHSRSRSYPTRESWRDREVEPLSDVIHTLANRLFVNSGTIFSLRVDPTTASQISIKRIDNNELDEDAVMTWRVHGIKVYRERIAALLGPSEPANAKVSGEVTSLAHAATPRGDVYMGEIAANGWITLLFL